MLTKPALAIPRSFGKLQLRKSNYLITSWDIATHKMGLPTHPAVTEFENLAELLLRIYGSSQQLSLKYFPSWWWGGGGGKGYGNTTKSQIQLEFHAA